MSEYDLLSAWFRVVEWTAYDLAKEGAEGIVLMPLGKHSNAATFIARAASKSSSYQHRKIAASLVGWIEEPPPELLAKLFEQEVERDRRLPKEDLGRLETQSVVEDIVFSASFWARGERRRSPAFQLLQDIVERTIAGEYWNTASYALTTLCRHRAVGYEELLTRFRKFASGAKVDHPSRPSLSQERDFAANLVAKNPQALDAIESLLGQKEQAATNPRLDENSRAAVEDLVRAASQFRE